MLSLGRGTQHTKKKKIKNAYNGLKMTLVDFHHIELPPPPKNQQDKEEKASIAASPTDVKPQKPAKPAASPAAAAAAHPAQTSTPQSAASQPASGYPAAAPAAYPFPQDLPQVRGRHTRVSFLAESGSKIFCLNKRS